MFNGKIFVRPDAQKTDAKQTNQALLLSDDAAINTKPQLEIFADDVKCTHGATVGQLDREALFYLRSRGISDEQARDLLIYAFASDVVERHRVPEVRAAARRGPAGRAGAAGASSLRGSRHEHGRRSSASDRRTAEPDGFDVERVRRDFPILAGAGPRQAAGLPGQRGHHPEAAGGDRRDRRLLRHTTTRTSTAASTS